MKTTLLLRPVLSAVIFSALAKSAVLWAEEPVRLTETQMDAATAGAAITLGVSAFAAADGPNTSTSTSTSTRIISTPSNNVQIGLGSGRAVACCGSNTYTDVHTAYYAEGDRVTAHSIETNFSNSRFSYSNGMAVVIAVDIPSK